MTCIIGLIENGHVYMAADSAVTLNWEVHAAEWPKIFKRGGMLIASAGDVRLSQLLRYTMAIRPQAGQDDLCYLVTTFAEDVRTCLKEHGFAKVEDNQEEGGHFMVAYRGGLYVVETDYTVLPAASGLAAIGSGREFALGAMYAMSPALGVRERLLRSLEASARFCVAVRGPFYVEELQT